MIFKIQQSNFDILANLRMRYQLQRSSRKDHGDKNAQKDQPYALFKSKISLKCQIKLSTIPSSVFNFSWQNNLHVILNKREASSKKMWFPNAPKILVVTVLCLNIYYLSRASEIKTSQHSKQLCAWIDAFAQWPFLYDIVQKIGSLHNKWNLIDSIIICWVLFFWFFGFYKKPVESCLDLLGRKKRS